MFKYDVNTGSTPMVHDLVTICHTSSDMDGLTGSIGGWGDPSMSVALVIMDRPLDHGLYPDLVDVVSIPVVCLIPSSQPGQSL